MNAGELDQRLTFVERGTGVNALNEPTGTWAPLTTAHTVWAKNAGVSGRDIAAGAALSTTVDAKWIIRWRVVSPAWRVRWRGDDYQIVGEPAPLAGGRDWLEIRGRKVQP